MSKNVVFLGLDVDDKAFNYTFQFSNGVIESFFTKPLFSHLKKKIQEKTEQGFIVKCCYEASYIGFDLCRKLNALKNVDCEVIAPSLIPQIPGKAVKTDRVDSVNLARFYAKELLTPIYIPDEEDESVRDLLRSRIHLKEQLKQIRRHLLSVCRRRGLHYRQETNKPKASHWSETHLIWIRSKIKESQDDYLKKNLSYLMSSIDSLEASIESYDREIEELCKKGRYKEKIAAISCFRGIGYQSALTLVVEIGDIKRFQHPKQLVSYIGLGVRERSSGGKERKMGITRTGNKFLRTTLIECSQRSHYPPRVAKTLKKRREECKDEYVEIADRCIRRIHKKGSKLLYKGKHVNKIKAACARKMIGFVWESLSKVA